MLLHQELAIFVAYAQFNYIVVEMPQTIFKDFNSRASYHEPVKKNHTPAKVNCVWIFF